MSRVNLKRLAKELNLSVSTISRALSDSYEISVETKQKVLALAKELNYHPNPYAKSLRQHKSKTIAIVLPEIANNFFALAINGIEKIANERGYHVLIYLTHEDHLREIDFLNHLSNGRADGILLSMSSGTENIDHILSMLEKKVPLVLFDRVCKDIPTVKVTTNDFESGFAATEHLLSKGCKKIACLNPSNYLSIGKRRVQGYLEALKTSGMDYINVINCVSEDEKANYATIKKWLTSNDRPDGIFASVEQLAILTYEVCKDIKINIPSDVKIIGFSNLRTASLLNPSLTTITQPAFNIGLEAASSLFGLIEKAEFYTNKAQTLMLPSTLTERESTKATGQRPDAYHYQPTCT